MQPTYSHTREIPSLKEWSNRYYGQTAGENDRYNDEHPIVRQIKTSRTFQPVRPWLRPDNIAPHKAGKRPNQRQVTARIDPNKQRHDDSPEVALGVVAAEQWHHIRPEDRAGQVIEQIHREGRDVAIGRGLGDTGATSPLLAASTGQSGQ